MHSALAWLNPALPAEALDDAFQKLSRPEGATLDTRNRAFHRMLVNGVTVEYCDDDGAIRGAQARVIDYDQPSSDHWLAVNQVTVVEDKDERWPDVVLLVNGLPLGLFELKNLADEEATIWTAWQQIKTFKAQLPSAFAMNATLIVWDRVEARLGALIAGQEWFNPTFTVEFQDRHVLAKAVQA